MSNWRVLGKDGGLGEGKHFLALAKGFSFPQKKQN